MDEMDDYESSLHRTWVEGLATAGHLEAAQIALDSELKILRPNFNPDELVVSLPYSSAPQLPPESPLWDILAATLRGILKGNLADQNGNTLETDTFPIVFRMQLMKPEDGWRERMRHRLTKKQIQGAGEL